MTTTVSLASLSYITLASASLSDYILTISVRTSLCFEHVMVKLICRMIAMGMPYGIIVDGAAFQVSPWRLV